MPSFLFSFNNIFYQILIYGYTAVGNFSATGKTGHIIAAIGQIVDSSHTVDFVGVYRFSSDKDIYGYRPAVFFTILRRNVLAHAIALGISHDFKHRCEIGAFDIDDRYVILERLKIDNLASGEFSGRNIRAETAFVRYGKIDPVDKLRAFVENEIRKIILQFNARNSKIVWRSADPCSCRSARRLR